MHDKPIRPRLNRRLRLILGDALGAILIAAMFAAILVMAP